MPHAGVLARRYAEGLLGVVRETGRFVEVATELQGLVDLLEESADAKDVMENPVYSTQDRLELLEGLKTKLNLSDPTYGLMRLVIEKRRGSYLGEINQAYSELYRAEIGVVQADVFVAHEIDEALKSRVVQAIETMTGKKPELTIHKDPSLIGGVRVQMGNTVLDASVKTKLEELRSELLETPVAAS